MIQGNNCKVSILQNAVHEFLLVLDQNSYLLFVDNMLIYYGSLVDYISLMLDIFNIEVLLLLLHKQVSQYYELDRN